MSSAFVYGAKYDMKLVLLEEEASKTGAVCLDGSPPGFYFRPGSGENANKFALHFLGGGWCWTLEDCAQRAQTFIGTSKLWTPLFSDMHDQYLPSGGMKLGDPALKPVFANWNLVYIMYCTSSPHAPLGFWFYSSVFELPVVKLLVVKLLVVDLMVVKCMFVCVRVCEGVTLSL